MSRFDIITAKHSGFCFGVQRAVDLACDTAKKYGICKTLGPLIHNSTETDRLKSLGVDIANGINDCDCVTIIRSHGVAKNVYRELSAKGIEYVDATCPFVAKIHEIVSQDADGVIIAGDKNHAEVQGIVGHCTVPENFIYVIDTEEELIQALNELKSVGKIAPILVAQTTYNSSKWQTYIQIAKKYCTNIKIFGTICSATANRQRATEELAKISDLMIVVGGKNSSNTAKLAQISQKHCPVIFAQTGSDIDTAEVRSLLSLKDKGIVGITAGASTPAYIIKEVHRIMSEILNDEDIDFMAEVDKTFKKVYIGNRVKALVVAVNNSEAVVDLGTKHSGYIPASELSHNPNAVPSDIVSVGDEIEAVVTSINDADGVVYLSKKKVDSMLGIEKMTTAMEENKTLEGEVTAVVKGGVIIVSNGVRVFVPASQTGVPKSGKLEELLKKTVSFKVIEVTEARGRVVGSIRMAKKEENDAANDKFWESIEEGQKFTGEVKSIESYGVFVDLGGVDGMVHSSELTWSRIKHPKEVVSIGDKLDVYVKSFDPEKKRVSLGCKKAEDNPWLKFMADYKVDDVVDVTVVSITPFGAFAQIIPGVDGLIHISQISTERVNNVAQVLSIGEKVTAKIIEINEEQARVSLSIRALKEEAPAAEEEATEEATEEAAEEAPAEE